MNELDIKIVKSRAREVTFFEDRARVYRVAKASASSGLSTLLVQGASALIDDAGLVVTINGGDEIGATVKAARVRRRWESDDEDKQELRRREEEARRLLEEAKSALEIVNDEHSGLLDLEANLIRQIARVPNTGEKGAKDWAAAIDELSEPLSTLRAETIEAMQKVRELSDKHADAYERLQEAMRETPELVADVEVQIDAAESAEVEIVLEYFVPCALWRPSHRARFIAGDDPRVEMTTLATVWQQTGERWEDITARFSTARLSKPTSAPLIDDDVLLSRQKSSEERKTIQAELRDQVINEMADGERQAVDEMPGIDDGGKPLTFVADKAVTIPSDGAPLQVECAHTDLAVDVHARIYPELMDAPHLMTRGVWNGDTPLLAGPVTLIRGNEFAGRTRQDFIAVGEPFELGFGPQNAVRVRRSVFEQRGKTRITGKQWIEKNMTLFISNISGDEQRFEVVERVPVSEIDEISITVNDREADADGFIRFSVVLKPRETVEEFLAYRLESDAKVELTI